MEDVDELGFGEAQLGGEYGEVVAVEAGGEASGQFGVAAEVAREDGAEAYLFAVEAVEAGVEEVHDLGLCTMCHPELFFSHRRDRGVTGRQAGVVWRA